MEGNYYSSSGGDRDGYDSHRQGRGRQGSGLDRGQEDMAASRGGGRGMGFRGTPENSKTKMCMRWKNGDCRFGDRCNFAHGEAELRRSQAAPTRAYYEDDPLTSSHDTLRNGYHSREGEANYAEEGGNYGDQRESVRREYNAPSRGGRPPSYATGRLILRATYEDHRRDFPPSRDEEQHLKMEDQQLQAAGESINQFALRFQKIIQGKGNYSFSPMSIFNAIGLLFAGASGPTADQIQNLIGLQTLKNHQILEIYKSLVENLESVSAECKLFSANRIYSEKSIKFSQQYTEKTEKYLHADVKSADFKGAAEEERGKINSWVQEVTQNMIKDLLGAGSVDSETVAVLVNALYFKGIWEEKFMLDQTYEDDFRTSTGEVVKVNMMAQYGKKYVVGNIVNLSSSFIQLPYQGRDTCMYIIMPKPLQLANELPPRGTPQGYPYGVYGLPLQPVHATTTLDQLISQLDTSHLRSMMAHSHDVRVELYLPRFTVEHSIMLADPLKKLGMIHAFDPLTANFENMIAAGEKEKFFVSEGFHKSKVIVDEVGTEAAAATAFRMMRYGSPCVPIQTYVFKVDQPFLFFIVHKNSASVLFMGKMDNPAS